MISILPFSITWSNADLPEEPELHVLFGDVPAFQPLQGEHSQLKSAQSYQMFMRNDPLFANYEVVVINAWNFETNGSLEVKLRIAPPPEETRIPHP